MRTCAACRYDNSDVANYCSQCGHQLRPNETHIDGERRYCTVLFCDLVGSSRLSHQLEEEAYRDVVRLVHQRCSAVVARYGGEVSQYLGDGILVLFGYPRAHEDDAARAVQAALDMQLAIPTCAANVGERFALDDVTLHSRAAVHTGHVVITETGEGRRRTVLALGESVNIAANLQQIAPIDSLLVTEATRRLLGGRFDLEPQGPTSIRGLPRATAIFRVLGPGPHVRRHDAARHHDVTPFVGRDRDLARIVDRWDKALAGEGQVVVVTGEPGIGKSRLLGALKDALGLSERWVELRGSQYFEASELRPVAELLERRVLRGTTGPLGRQRLEQELAAIGLGRGDVAALLGSLLSLPSAADEAPLPLLPDQRRRQTLAALTEWFHRLADEAPVALVFEDLQWIDPTTLELLSRLVADVSRSPALIVVTCRTPFEPPWGPQQNELRLTLSPLSREDATRLVRSIARDRAPTQQVLDDILDKGDGVPLFLEEVTRMLVAAGTALHSVPDNLRELLSARLDTLPPDALDTLRLGAVLGRQFSGPLLLALSTKDAEAIDGDLGVLLDSAVWRVSTGGYAFKHALLRDVAYERMLRVTRTELHGRAAAALRDRCPHLAETQPEVVAHHLTEAGATRDAAQEWTRAGTRSLRNGAYLEASRHFERALTLRARLPVPSELRTAHAQEELGLRKDFGISLIATQGYTSKAVAENYEKALQWNAELSDQAAPIPMHILYGLWGTCLVRGDRGATDALAKQFEGFESSPDPLARHVAHSTLGARAFYRGDFATALDRCERAIALYDPADHYVLMRDYGYEGGLYSHSYVACIRCFTGFPDTAWATINDVRRISQSIGDPYSRAVSLGFAACIARERSEPAVTKGLAEELIALATEHQFVMWLGIAHCLRGWAVLRTGDTARGAEETASGLGIWEATGAKVPGTYLRLNMVEAALANGDIVSGLAHVERGLEQCRTTLECYQEPEYRRLKGELLCRTGNMGAAGEEAQAALAGARAQGALWIELRAALSLARMARAGHLPIDRVGTVADAMARLSEGMETSLVTEAAGFLGGLETAINFAR